MSTYLIGLNAGTRTYLFCVLTSSAGRNAYFVLAAWIATEMADGAKALAILLALGSAAEMLTSNMGGALVDRFDRRLVCVGCEISRLALMLLTGLGFFLRDPLVVLYGSWIMFTIADRAYSTALQAMIPSLVRVEQFGRFNSLSYFAMQAGNLLAALVTGYALAAIGGTSAPIVPAAFFVLSLSALMAMPSQEQPSLSEDPRRRSGIRRIDVLPTTFTLPSLKAITLIYALIYTMGMIVSVLGAAYVVHDLFGSAVQFGYLEAGWAIGSIAGCTTVFFGRALLRRRSILFHLALAGIILTGFWIHRNFAVAFIQVMFLGLSYNIARILIDVLVQSAVSLDMLGRVRSQIHTVCVAVGLVAYGIIALLGHAIQPTEIFGLFGMLMIGAALLLYFRMGRGGPLESGFV